MVWYANATFPWRSEMEHIVVKELIKEDACRWIHPGQVYPVSALQPRMVERLLFQHAALRAVAWYRVGHWCKQNKVRAAGLIQRMVMRRYGLEIVVHAPIGGGLYIPHPVGTVVSPSRMGKNCSIIASVTIGMRNEWAFPSFGDHVFIGAGARVLGGITVGDNAVIGANAVVIHDVAAGATVVGIPARPIGSIYNY